MQSIVRPGDGSRQNTQCVSLLDILFTVHLGSKQLSIDSLELLKAAHLLPGVLVTPGPQMLSHIPVIRVKPFIKASALLIRGKAQRHEHTESICSCP